ncbi:MAG: leucine-rich repeat protein [Bacteroidales bacterium]|nr:leucine-rich repeat protein [Bacteroidales bacterium]
MKKNIYFALGVIAFVLAGCQTIEESFNFGGLTAVTESAPDTKTTLSSSGSGASKVFWSEGDEIGVFIDDASTPAKFTLKRGAGSNTATFTGDGAGKSYLAFYPQSMLSSRSGNTISFVLPAEQEYVNGTFADGAYPMAAASSSSELQFRNLCSVVRISLVGSQAVSKIVFTANDPSVKVSGPASVDVSAGGAPTVVMGSDASNSVTLNTGNVQLTNTAATDFYLVLPAQTYTGGFTVQVYAGDEVIEKSYNSDFTMERSKMHKAAVFAFDEPQDVNNWLTFTSEGTTTIRLINYEGNAPVLYYSEDGETWAQWDYSELSFSGSKPLYLCGDNPDGFNQNFGTYSQFFASGDKFGVSGSIMSLIDKTEVIDVIPNSDCFQSLFKSCELLTSAPELPATTLTDCCYYMMFKDCTSLTEAPELPAMAVGWNTYGYMFNNCTSLTKAPALPATTLDSYAYEVMFCGCSSLTEAPALPADDLPAMVYACMFENCTSLREAPALPATNLGNQCYGGMFKGCTSLTEAPELRATTMNTYSYYNMFNGCTSLTEAPELPATTLAKGCYYFMFAASGLTSAPELPVTDLAENCYLGMFQGCTGLTEAPVLPATTMEKSCYQQMFYGCTGLTEAPELPAENLAENCYSHMFNGCTGLTKAPELPATTLAPSCYGSMFVGCSNLSEVPELPATRMEEYCYMNMFGDCTSLTEAPALTATELAEGCYYTMFYRCSNLQSAPALPAETLADYCYRWMFASCTSLEYIECLATDISAEGCTEDWVYAVPATGTFVKAASMEDWPDGTSGIPAGWTVLNDDGSPVGSITASNYLTFTSTGTTSVSLTNNDGNAPLVYYSYDAENWEKWDYSELSFTSSQPLYICGDNPNGFSQMLSRSNFTASGSTFEVSGDIMSLIEKDGQLDTVPGEYCFYRLFTDCTLLTSAPELPATQLGKACYYYMFYGCTGLTTAPELPAMTLAESCYESMFRGCTGLTSAPELPALDLDVLCYASMFHSCTSLTTAPELPATTLTATCYNNMFRNCTGLTSAPDLPATRVEYRSYNAMFKGCSNLNYVKCIATDISEEDCINNWLDGVSASGTFVKAAAMNDWPEGASGIPAGWTVLNDDGTPVQITPSNYLTFTSEGSTTISLSNVGGNTPVLYYSYDGTDWEKWDYSELTFTSSNPLYLCGDNPNGFNHKFYPSDESGIYSKFITDGSKFGITGSIMSLIDKDDDVTVIPSSKCFAALFKDCSKLTDAPDLPATGLSELCYRSMFYGCTSLTASPELPATSLTEGCYYEMFYGCTSLTSAPDLPATTLADVCYCAMFEGCSSLTSAPDLPATTMKISCYSIMFARCTSLTTAPELPATTLDEACYWYMFHDCTSLTTAPELPATTLKYGSYGYMFNGCKNIDYVKCLATDISAERCTMGWMEGVASHGTFVKAASMEDWTNGSDGIPEEWTVVDAE